jgi:hypothetical protein
MGVLRRILSGKGEAEAEARGGGEGVSRMPSRAWGEGEDRGIEKDESESETAEGVVKTPSRTWGDSGEGVESAIG